MNASCPDPLVMLIIEDNPADVVFFAEAIKATAMPAASKWSPTAKTRCDFFAGSCLSPMPRNRM